MALSTLGRGEGNSAKKGPNLRQSLTSDSLLVLWIGSLESHLTKARGSTPVTWLKLAHIWDTEKVRVSGSHFLSGLAEKSPTIEIITKMVLPRL